MRGGGARYNITVKFRDIGVIFLGLAMTILLIANWLIVRGMLPFTEADAQTLVSGAFDYEVLYTGSGFVPDYLSVPIGSRVAFRNAATSTPLWVASDPYPGRTDYPALDAQQDYGPGATYIFTFDQSGTFGYHNQEVPIDDATISVVDPNNPVPDISKTQERQQAVRDKLVAMLVPGDPNSIFTVIDAIDADTVLSLDCHDIAHDLGHRAYELYGFSGAMTYSNPERVNHTSVMDVCAGGYVHGILEEASLHDHNFGDNPGALCENVPSSNKAGCYHGVGHALMFFNNRDIQASLDGCRKLDNVNDASRCFEGVWMETFWGNTEHSGPGTLGWDLDKPLDPCIQTQPDAKPACFIYASFGYLRTHVRDYAGAVRLCTQSELDGSDTSYCLKGVGITMVTHFKATHLEQSEALVAGLTVDQKHGFYEGVIGYARLSGVSETELVRTCAAMQTDASICAAALEDSK